MNIEDFIPPIAQMLGVEPATVLLMLGIVVAVANLLGRVIPDDAGGWLGMVRKASKLLGLFVPNRVTSGISVNDTAKAVVRELGQVKVRKEAESDAPIPAFPNLPSPDDGK